MKTSLLRPISMGKRLGSALSSTNWLGVVWTTLLSANALWAHAEDYRYRVELLGKPDAELAPLSERAMQRRARQGIALDSADYTLSPRYVAALRDAGLTLCSQSRWLNTAVVRRADGAAIDSAFWTAFPFVQRVTVVSGSSAENLPVLRRKKWQTEMPDERLDLANSAAQRRSLADVHEAAEDFRAPWSEVHAEALCDAGYRGRGMLIAVIDGGFYHTDLFPWLSSHVVGCRDLYTPQQPDHLYQLCTHGTCVLSVMASDSTQGIWGTASDADYFLIRSENEEVEIPYEEDLWVAAAELADSSGADLINSSLGYTTFDAPFAGHTQSEWGQGTAYISRGARVACSRGILVCNAAGNEGSGSWRGLLFPADEPEVLTVGATNRDLKYASFTSVGFLSPWVKPDVACRGQGAYIVNTESGRPMRGNGTSFAAPFLCGCAASLWQAAPSLTAQQVRDVIRQSARQHSEALQWDLPDERLGYGLPDFSVALSAALELEAAASLPTIENATDATVSLRIYDLYGRPLTAPPTHGYYITGGKIRVR